MTEKDIAKQAITAHLAGIANKTDLGIEWDVSGHKIYVNIINAKNHEARIIWPMEDNGHWIIDVKKERVIDIKWEKK